jgi:hypothetical protein
MGYISYIAGGLGACSKVGGCYKMRVLKCVQNIERDSCVKGGKGKKERKKEKKTGRSENHRDGTLRRETKKEMATTEKVDGAVHLEYGREGREAAAEEGVSVDGEVVDVDMDVHDEKANQRLNRRLDKRILPLCCWVYLLNFLDRGTILSCPSLPSFPSRRHVYISILPSQEAITNAGRTAKAHRRRKHRQLEGAQRRDGRRPAAAHGHGAWRVCAYGDAVQRCIYAVRGAE